MERVVVRVDDAVAVGIERRELDESGDGRVPEQFRDVVDPAVAVEIAHEQAVVASHPGGAAGEAVSGEVEIHLARLAARQLYSVPVEIEHQRIGARITAGEARADGEFDVVAEFRDRRLADDLPERHDPAGRGARVEIELVILDHRLSRPPPGVLDDELPARREPVAHGEHAGNVDERQDGAEDVGERSGHR